MVDQSRFLGSEPNHIDVRVSFLIIVLALYWDLGDDRLLDSVCDTAVLEGFCNLMVESLNCAAPSTPLAIAREKAREPAGLLVSLGLVLLKALVVALLVLDDDYVPGPLRGVARSRDGDGKQGERTVSCFSSVPSQLCFQVVEVLSSYTSPPVEAMFSLMAGNNGLKCLSKSNTG